MNSRSFIPQMTISKSDIKLINQLKSKKYRQKYKLFIAEGRKLVKELMDEGVEVYRLFSSNNNLFLDTGDFTKISSSELKKISLMKAQKDVLGIFKIPDNKPINLSGLIIALDQIRDPGNLGTIIRLCDWYSVRHIVCDYKTVDCYNSKVVQATMGSIARISVYYLDLDAFIKKSSIPIYAMSMTGKNIKKVAFEENSIIVMGNESKGISDSIAQKSKLVTIPRYNTSHQPESLNVASSMAIALYEIRGFIE